MNEQHPARRQRHGQRPTEPLTGWPEDFGADLARAAEAAQPASSDAELAKLKALALAATHMQQTVSEQGAALAVFEWAMSQTSPAVVLDLIARIERAAAPTDAAELASELRSAAKLLRQNLSHAAGTKNWSDSTQSVACNKAADYFESIAFADKAPANGMPISDRELSELRRLVGNAGVYDSENLSPEGAMASFWSLIHSINLKIESKDASQRAAAPAPTDWTIHDPHGVIARLRTASQDMLTAAGKHVGWRDDNELSKAATELDEALAAAVGIEDSIEASNWKAEAESLLEEVKRYREIFSAACSGNYAAAPADIGPRWDENGELWNEAAEKVERERADGPATASGDLPADLSYLIEYVPHTAARRALASKIKETIRAAVSASQAAPVGGEITSIDTPEFRQAVKAIGLSGGEYPISALIAHIDGKISAAVAAAKVPTSVMPNDWVALSVIYNEDMQAPEEVAYGPPHMMNRLGKWIDKLMAHEIASRVAPVEQGQGAGVVPEGWQIVPKQPTDKMTAIGQDLRYVSVNSIGEIYRQMLAAAPASPGAGADQVRNMVLDEADKAVAQVLWQIENGDGLRDEVYGAERCQAAIRALRSSSAEAAEGGAKNG